MFVAIFGEHDVTALQTLDRLRPALAIMHINRVIEDDEDLAAVIDVPDIRLVGPMQPHANVPIPKFA